MSQLRSPYVQTRRDAWVEVNLANIEHNIKSLKAFLSSNDKSEISKTKFLAVVKADAYGHGSAMTAPTLAASGVDMLGVASVDEGIQLRDSGVTIPILVLGAAPLWTYVSAIENDIQLSVFTDEHIKACLSACDKLNKKAFVHVKVDTGMHRIGISYEKALDFINKIKVNDRIRSKGIFTHLACAESIQYTEQQKIAWNSILSGLYSNNLIIKACRKYRGYD